jgi:hypothetical protein
MALAHKVSDKVEAAYSRGDLFDKRRQLMDDWAAYLAKPAAQVVPLRPRQRNDQRASPSDEATAGSAASAG